MKQMKHLEVRRQQLQILPWRSFKQHWELLTVACDQAEEFVESVKQRIGSKCLVDEATGSVTGKRGQPVAGFPPISGVRLKQMSKAVRWLVIELEQGSGNSGGSSHPNTLLPSTPDSQRIQLDRFVATPILLFQGCYIQIVRIRMMQVKRSVQATLISMGTIGLRRLSL
ncbi:hypothetical protein BVRB_1g001640 isoform B [Beta vulgaris subsp. vulgaris]|nr:hypothetical protein BVRB_1g001640 isoform B [Beta vulgaris subsp. vulgaris]